MCQKNASKSVFLAQNEPMEGEGGGVHNTKVDFLGGKQIIICSIKLTKCVYLKKKKQLHYIVCVEYSFVYSLF